MRVLMLNHNLVGRGSFLRCLHLARHLVARGHSVDLVSAADSASVRWGRMEDGGVRILLPPRLGQVGTHDGGYAPIDILSRLPLALGRWDLIHAFEHRPNVLVPALFSRLRGTPLVVDWSDWWTRGGITTPRRRWGFVDRLEARFLEEGFKRSADLVTVVSRALWDRARGIGIPEERLAMVPSGCDTTRIRPLDQARCREELGLPLSAPILSFVGFAFWDFELMIQALLHVLAEFPETLLVVAGQDKDSRIEEIVRGGLGERASRVRFLGRVEPERLAVPLSAADIHLLPLPNNPANRARWPIKVGDYLASGRATVVSSVGDPAEVIHREGAGIATDPTPKGMAGGILELLRNPGNRAQMGDRARALAEGELSWIRQGEKLEAAYERCLARRGRSG